MADGKVEFELVAPERLLMSTAVDMVVVPGSEGDFGVLEGHAPFISQVRPGVIEMHDNDQVTERIFVAAGFAEVTPERCTVLADEAMPLGELDNDQIDQRIADAERALEAAEDDAARHRAEAAIAVANAMREALEQAG